MHHGDGTECPKQKDKKSSLLPVFIHSTWLLVKVHKFTKYQLVKCQKSIIALSRNTLSYHSPGDCGAPVKAIEASRLSLAGVKGAAKAETLGRFKIHQVPRLPSVAIV
jgi:hypothetical protein